MAPCGGRLPPSWSGRGSPPLRRGHCDGLGWVKRDGRLSRRRLSGRVASGTAFLSTLASGQIVHSELVTLRRWLSPSMCRWARRTPFIANSWRRRGCTPAPRGRRAPTIAGGLPGGGVRWCAPSVGRCGHGRGRAIVSPSIISAMFVCMHRCTPACGERNEVSRKGVHTTTREDQEVYQRSWREKQTHELRDIM